MNTFRRRSLDWVEFAHLKHPLGDPLDKGGLALGEADIGHHLILQILEISGHTEVLEAAWVGPRHPRPVLQLTARLGRAEVKNSSMIEDTAWSRGSVCVERKHLDNS